MRAALIAAALLIGACARAPDEIGILSVNGSLTPANLPAFFDCLRQNGQAVVSAHRGGPTLGFAENAIPTLEHTLTTIGPTFLEIDVARTRDGALVLMHDDTVDRTTDGEGEVSSLTLAQFRALRLQDDAGATLDSHPPTLREALDWARPRAVLELDVKRGVSYEDVAREVQAAGAMARVVFITYSVEGAARVARLAPEAMIYTTIQSADDLDDLEQRGVDLAHIVAWLGADEIDLSLASALAARGVEVRVGQFGEGDPDFTRAAQSGVSIVAVDDVRRALRELNTNDGLDGGHAALQCVTAE